MRPRAYYNENDKFAAAWLRRLIKAKVIAHGEVDERSIVDVRASDLKGFTQCHFFAGIGAWSWALRQAGWRDEWPVWTGSCPCQGWSTAGKRKGFDDGRHLWPFWFELIRKRQPFIVFGEQVGGQGGRTWFYPVRTDLESIRYKIGSVEFPAAGIGAPHVRQRIYFVANYGSRRCHPILSGISSEKGTTKSQWNDSAGRGRARKLDNSKGRRFPMRGKTSRPNQSGRAAQPVGSIVLGNSSKSGLAIRKSSKDGTGVVGSQGKAVGIPSIISGVWQKAEWIWCTDKKFRPVEPGTFPLAHGTPARVGRLRGYGNAICAPQAQAFIEAYLECVNEIPSP